ncbi:MAG: aminodeoxychorismate/anthranilate synthase component II [Methanomicrobiales archaeon]|nr:aminodeoxychorismate/anthranilate synthase component II [Methanomicrobiales archaeon]
MNVLVIDCYDSFTFNLCQQVGALGAHPIVVTNDTSFMQVQKISCDRILLSPGPGTPEDSGVGLEILATMSHDIPTLGICLGHQAICVAFGGEVGPAPEMVHGKPSSIVHDGTGVFRGIPSPFPAGRYHSLAGSAESLPEDLLPTAHSLEDGQLMGVRHRRYPIYGVQFHPESILTPVGDKIIQNFLVSTVGGA